MCPSIYSSIDHFTHSSTHLIFHPLFCWLLSVHSFISLFIHLFTYPFVCSFIHSLFRQFIHPFIPVNHSFTIQSICPSLLLYLFCLIADSHIQFHLELSSLHFNRCDIPLKYFYFYLICPDYLLCHCWRGLYINLYVYFMQLGAWFIYSMHKRVSLT